MNKVINVHEIELVENPEGLKLFPNDVLERVEDQRVRLVNLDKATTLAKVSGTFANIVLNTQSGYKRIYAKVAGVDAGMVWIDGRIRIPIEAIYAIDLGN